MARRWSLAVLAVVGVALVGVAALAGVAVAESAAQEAEPPVDSCAKSPPPDFADPAGGNATVGWFDGYWYDEPIDVDASDGLTPEEFEALSARTAARLEAMRCLTFDERPPVDIQTRAEFAEENEETYAEVGETTRLFDNAQFETMLLVGNETDSVEVREADRTATVAGYYDIEEERIVVISDDPESLSIDEEILAHELGHALQGQHFDLGSYPRNTTDRDKGTLGLIEGDVHRIQQEYLEACEARAWSEPCATDGGGGSARTPSNMGLHLLQIQPYSDGPSFVERAFEDGGWAAVDALYEEPPTSALHVVEPETYGEVEPETLDIPDESGDGWERLTGDDLAAETGAENASDVPDYDVVGQAGLTAMLVDPSLSGDEPGPVTRGEFVNTVRFIGADQTDPYEYDQPETDDWRGDRLYVYADADGEDEGLDRETATVWRLAWADAAAADDFRAAYETLLEIRGAERVDGYAHTYAFGAESEFDGAVTLSSDGDRLSIVTAPSVEELTDVHDVNLVEADETTDTDADDEGDADTESNRSTEQNDESNRSSQSDDELRPGFGAPAAAVALLAVALALARRR